MTHADGMPTEPVHFANLADWLEENWGLDTTLGEVVKDLRNRSGEQAIADEEVSGQRKLIQVPRAIRRELVGTGRIGDPRDASPEFTRLPCREGPVPISSFVVTHYARKFPRVDVQGEIHKMKTWLEANPRSVKTRRGLPRFVTGWLLRVAGQVGQGRPGGEAPVGAPRVVGTNPDGSLRFA